LVSSRFLQNGLDSIEKEMIKIEVIFKSNSFIPNIQKLLK